MNSKNNRKPVEFDKDLCDIYHFTALKQNSYC